MREVIWPKALGDRNLRKIFDQAVTWTNLPLTMRETFASSIYNNGDYGRPCFDGNACTSMAIRAQRPVRRAAPLNTHVQRMATTLLQEITRARHCPARLPWPPREYRNSTKRIASPAYKGEEKKPNVRKGFVPRDMDSVWNEQRFDQRCLVQNDK